MTVTPYLDIGLTSVCMYRWQQPDRQSYNTYKDVFSLCANVEKNDHSHITPDGFNTARYAQRNASVQQEFLEDYHLDEECCFCHGIQEF